MSGLSDRNKGWMCASLDAPSAVLGRGPRGGLTSRAGGLRERVGESGGIGEEGVSSSSLQGKGPSRGFAGEPGRLAGMGSRRPGM